MLTKKQATKRLNWSIAFSAAILSGAAWFGWAMYNGCLKPEADTNGGWFQRSGALIIMLCIFAEVLIQRSNGIITATGNGGIYPPFDDESRQESINTLLKWIAIAGAVIGTLIWGYGDLLYGISWARLS